MIESKETIQVLDKTFEVYLSKERIAERVMELGAQITRDYQGRSLLLVGMLNGAFMFSADLMRAIDIPTEITFVRYKSYQGMESTGQVNQLLGINRDLTDTHILIVEDIVDTGFTMKEAMAYFNSLNPRSIAVASLLLKPDCLQTELEIEYVGFEIPEKFVVGYGLDYDGLGRNLKDIYQLKEDKL